MSPIPVGLSMLMSFMSAIMILGSTAEMYTKGTQWFMIGPGICLAVVICACLFVPLLYPLQLTSIFEVFITDFAYFSCHAWSQFVDRLDIAKGTQWAIFE